MTGPTVSALLSPLDLHVPDFSFINISVQLDCRDNTGSGEPRPSVWGYGSKTFGTRVGRPANGICYVGGACAFQLLLYDTDDQPVKVGELMHNMSIRLADDQEYLMVEDHEGAFEATIPTDWVTNQVPIRSEPVGRLSARGRSPTMR